MSSEPVIEAHGLGKAYLIYAKPEDRLKQMFWRGRRKLYQEYWAFQNVDLSIGRGETVGIIGRNGSGKSTLLQVIAGTLQPNAGTIAVTGRVAPLLELGAGFNPEFTGRENVKLSGTILGLTAEEVDERYAEIVEFSGIGEFIDQPVKNYSSGMYARLAFAVAAHVEADVFIVDETLSVGDFAFQHKCLAKLDERKEAGATILFVTHDISQIRRICDRAIYMREGRIEMIGPTRPVCDRYFEDVSGLTTHDRPVRQVTIAHEAVGPDEGAASVPAPKLSLQRLQHFAEGVESTRTGPRSRGAIDCVSVNGAVVEAATLEFAEDLIVEVDLTIFEPFEHATLSFYIVDTAGQLLVGTNTHYEELPDDAISEPGMHCVTFKFSNRLMAGEYGVTVILSEFDPLQKTNYEDYISLAGRFVSLPALGNERWAFFSPEVATNHTTRPNPGAIVYEGA